MPDIIFKAAFGNQDKTVELSTPNGGAGGYYFMIDKFYQGIINNQLHGFRVVLQNPNPDYTQADFDILIDIVKEYEVPKSRNYTLNWSGLRRTNFVLCPLPD